MIQDFRLPDLGEGLPEAELVSWQVAEGQTVTLNQTIAEVETAKAVVELPSPFAGTVATLHAAAGDVVEVGSVLISFDLPGAEAESRVADPVSTPSVVAAAASATAGSGAPSPSAPEAPVEEKSQPNLVGYGAAPRSTARPQRRARAGAVSGAAAASDSAVREAAPHDAIGAHGGAESLADALLDRPRSTPPVRRLAKDLGVDLAVVAGTGRHGLITRQDVEAFAKRRDAAATTSPEVARAGIPSGGDDGSRTTRTPIRGVRKHTAQAMVRSAFTAPHVTTFLTVDVTPTMELVASLKRDRALEGHRIGILAVAAKAVCLALGAHPELNSQWDEDAYEIVQHHDVHLGIAAATGRGLVVPNIRRAQELTLVELADAIGALAETARAGRTTPAEMSGGTFSITNVGVFGVDAGTPIINPGEAGILALGAIRRQPWEFRGEIALRDVMTLALSFDHRLVDGEQGARFLTAVGDVLREPGRAMLLR
ncbi:Dihydrolipoyllysine-residue acetyltransferase component of pyruvate dehydrogenase complex [Microbacterium lemovicicum]|uniref:Dihydrolipoamide acetyltransferase component of pyruvate dehydrogenase complex n=1 Tax=Microbacterium lemovicicum TaxID=1072463 RepID=A0A3Q9IYV8_9MICO|nr:dihydrolipoamide acetyltransferase family protein [Microbacterium lemovicicum]AZS36666.1 Dihydrolipoyllysine-residue acetyltransferase component of pyruvate dehydrogenase complex [Microbacterium lemovicicum]